MLDQIKEAVADLSIKSGLDFAVTDTMVEGTQLYVAYAAAHPFPERYTITSGVFGFRVPSNFPDACPEDSFFLQPASLKLKQADTVRNSFDLNRVSSDQNFLKGTALGANPALVFSWHIWNKVAWNRKKHTLVDHYNHCMRRFDQPEHD